MRQIVDKYEQVLQTSRLFQGLDASQCVAALEFFGAALAESRRGEFLHHAGQPLKQFGFVLEGIVQACSDDLSGNRMIMASVSPGGTFGESLCFLKVAEAPVYIYSLEPSRILWLSAEKIASVACTPFEIEMKNRFISMLAERTLSMNNRIQILSKLTLREKLITYFSQLSAAAGSRTFTLPFGRDDMATYLGTNRSALSRELSRMKDEGIIDYYRNMFRIVEE